MIENVELLCHNCIRFFGDTAIYTDPFKLNKIYSDADIILITHSHYDHFSEEDIKKVKKEDTKIVITDDLYDQTIELGFDKENIFMVKPNQNLEINNIKIKAIPAYNTNKNFHPKENNWVGYILEINDVKYYIAGDTDITEENKAIKCDVAFVPVGGTYTMTGKEAATLVNEIKPKIAIPVHYGVIVGTKEDAIEFEENLISDIQCKKLMK